MDEQRNPFPPGPETATEELEITRILLTLWHHRIWLATSTFAFTLLGLLYVVLATPVYRSEAIIALKEKGKDGNTSNLFSQLGGMGGSVALGLGVGSTNLNKIEITLKGRELAQSVITTNNLMPSLFPTQWSLASDSWENPRKAPTLRSGVEILRSKILTVNVDTKKSLITVGVNHPNPLLAKQIVDFYLVGLNRKIRQDVVSEAELNRVFLEKQLSRATDPILAEKINNLIASEIEKMMFASAQSIEVLEGPVVPLTRTSPKKSRTVILAFVIGLLLSSASVFAWKSVHKMRAVLRRGKVSPLKDGY